MKALNKSFIFIVLLLVVLVISACSDESAKENEGGNEDSLEVTSSNNDEADGFNWKQFSGESITLLANKQPWLEQLQPRINEFEELTGINVNVQTYPEDQIRQKALVSLQSQSDEFDVFMSLKSREGLKYYNAGFYDSLDDYVENSNLTSPDFDIDDFYDGPIEGEIINEELVGLPINVEGPVLYYNKELFEQYGAKVPETIDEIEVAAKIIQDGSGGDIHGVTLRGEPGAMPYTFGNFIYNNGKEWLEDGKPDFQDPTRINAIESYANLAKNYGPPGVVQYTFYQSSALFAQGRVAMEIESSNELSTILDEKSSTVADKVGVVAFPAGSGESNLTQLQWGLSINNFSNKKEAAWLFMQWATSKEMQLELAYEGIGSPRTSTWESDKYQESLDSNVKKEWAEALQFTLDNGNPDIGPPAEDQDKVRKIVGEMVGKVILEEMTAEDAAKEADKRMAEVLDE